MGDRYLDLLLRGMKALHNAALGFIKCYSAPPTPAVRQNTYTDQW